MFTSSLILLLCLVVYAVADAVIDKTMFHYSNSVFKLLDPKIWNPAESWKRKYKRGDPKLGRAFIGATTWLVWATDSFHFMKQIQILCMGVMAGVLVQEVLEFKAWWVFWGAWALAQIILSVVFHYFFHTVFMAKNKDVNV